MICPKCTGGYRVKNGLLNEKQRYNCKGCGNNYTVSQKYTAKLPFRMQAWLDDVFIRFRLSFYRNDYRG